MAKVKAGPKVLTANRLRDGAVVYFAADNAWTELVDAAVVAQSPEQLTDLQDRAGVAVRSNQVIDVVAIDVTAAQSQQPISLRERIRLVGPTVRPDLARL